MESTFSIYSSKSDELMHLYVEIERLTAVGACSYKIDEIEARINELEN